MLKPPPGTRAIQRPKANDDSSEYDSPAALGQSKRTRTLLVVSLVTLAPREF